MIKIFIIFSSETPVILVINHVKDEEATQMSLRSKSVSWRSSVPLKKSTWELSFEAGSDSGATSKENSNPDASENYELWLVNLVKNTILPNLIEYENGYISCFYINIG